MPDEVKAATILVVDDHPFTGQVIEEGLSAAGYKVVRTESGAGALQAFAASSVDLVLMDILMPGMDGFETLRRLRELPRGAVAPVVFLTALNDSATHSRALASGADDLLGKPINRVELLMRVRSLLWVRRLRDEVAAQRDALLEANRQKEELTALLVHDLKSPLATIVAGAEFLAHTEGISADSLDCAADIAYAAEALQQMVLNLLDISRSEDGRLELAPADFGAGALAREVCGRLARRAEGHKVRLWCEPEQDPVVRADRDLLRRILENLLDNALAVSPRAGEVRVEVEAVDGSAELRVRDQGPGVPPELRERIFEKYVRIQLKDRPRHGRGLGLTFCRLAAQAHGGRVWVEPNGECGSVFRVRIPLRPEPG
jgi:signal transduction histidine kinase